MSGTCPALPRYLSGTWSVLGRYLSGPCPVDGRYVAPDSFSHSHIHSSTFTTLITFTTLVHRTIALEPCFLFLAVDHIIKLRAVGNISAGAVAAAGAGQGIEATPVKEGGSKLTIGGDLVFHIHIGQEEEILVRNGGAAYCVEVEITAKGDDQPVVDQRFDELKTHVLPGVVRSAGIGSGPRQVRGHP